MPVPHRVTLPLRSHRSMQFGISRSLWRGLLMAGLCVLSSLHTEFRGCFVCVWLYVCVSMCVCVCVCLCLCLCLLLHLQQSFASPRFGCHFCNKSPNIFPSLALFNILFVKLQTQKQRVTSNKQGDNKVTRQIYKHKHTICTSP